MKLPIEHLPTIQTAEFGSYHLNWREAGNGETVIYFMVLAQARHRGFIN